MQVSMHVFTTMWFQCTFVVESMDKQGVVQVVNPFDKGVYVF